MTRTASRLFLALVAAVSISAGALNYAHAAMITVIANAADGETRDTNLDGNGDIINTTQDSRRVGVWAGNSDRRSIVYPFQIPVLPAGEEIVSASFSAYYVGSQPASYNADLYVLDRGPSVSPTALATDLNSSATLLLDDFVTSSSTTNQYVTMTDGNLLSYLYGLGSSAAGKYVFITIRDDYPSVPVADENGYQFRMSEAALGFQPLLTITTAVPVPEPSTLWLLTLGALGLARLARHRGNTPIA